MPTPTPNWWKSASIYQIYPSSFATTPSNPTPIGTIKGITSKLPYLSSLGVDAIWLCPIYASPQQDMGYDISDYRAIHEPYGSMADVEEMIARCKEVGLKVVMDLVVNHTSDLHEWFIESKTGGRDGPKRSWYIWRDAKYTASGERRAPNNWESAFGGSAWTWDEGSQQYYLGLFCPEQPDLNWDNEDVVKEVHAVMEFWLEKGIDGFRMDVINMISKDPSLPDGAVVIEGRELQSGHASYAYGPRLNEHLKGLRRVLDRYDAFAVGEMPMVNELEKVKNVVAEERRELNMIFQFDLVDMDIGAEGKFSPRSWDANTFKDIVGKWQGFMWEVNGWNALFLENHDQPRSVSRWCGRGIGREREVKGAKMLATFLAMQAGTLFVYQGQELGMTNLPEEWGLEEYKDIETQKQYKEAVGYFKGDEAKMRVYMEEVHKKARDHARSPVQWSGEENGGFTSPEVTPWMRVNDNYREVNAEQQESDPDSVLNYWREVLKVRKSHQEVIVYGRFELVKDGHPEVICYKRVGTGKTDAWVVVSFKNGEVEYKAPEDLRVAVKSGKQVLGNYEEEVQVEGEVLRLKPFEARVFMVER